MITFDPDALTARRAELEARMGEPGFWDDQERAAKISTEHSRIARKLDSYEQLTRDYEDAQELFSMDGGMEDEITSSIAPLRQELERLQEQALFSGEYDAGDAVVTLQSDVGGTDAQDFTEMLLRMYERWADHRGIKTEVIEASPGEEAGLKSATFTVEGENAYGILRAERGKHRLVRLSPFDQAHRRHTSFAQVIPAPLLAQDETLEIDEGDLRIDTYRAQGAGGQHVNKTDSAVRFTHIPTGIVVTCQNERSQHRNRTMAMKILRARLYEVELEKQKEKMEDLHKSKKEIAWGSQIRSYVLHPYRMVKDHRTGVEVGNADAVLDGGIDVFIEAYLHQRIAA